MFSYLIHDCTLSIQIRYLYMHAPYGLADCHVIGIGYPHGGVSRKVTHDMTYGSATRYEVW